jgi:DASS family divalent anion:Na+ symporter
VWLLPHSPAIEPRAWRLLTIFVATIAGIVARPLPMSAIALVGLAAILSTRTLTIAEALSGFANPTSWLVVSTFFLAAGFTKTGLGSRIAYALVAVSGRTTLGLAYGLMATDLALAPAIASNTARAGGVVYPILQSIVDRVLAPDGGRAPRASAFLTLTAYQATVVTGSMFLTAMVANPLVVQLAAAQGIVVTWTQWLTAAVVPGVVSMAITPLIVYRVVRPEQLTADARKLARSALGAMGPMSRGETIMAITSLGLIAAWIAGPRIALDPSAAALIAVAALLISGVLSWDDLLRVSEAWNTFVWFGVLLTMATFLGETGLIRAFSTGMAAQFEGVGWVRGFLGLSLVYFYSHYFFASNTAHSGAMFAPFLAVALALGTPPMLATLVLAFFSNLCACTTHYGTPAGPVLFGSGYVPLGTWWKAGAILSAVHIVTWLGIGALWWRLLGLW